MSSEVDDRLRAHTANIRPGSAREEEPSIVKRLREQVEREPDGAMMAENQVSYRKSSETARPTSSPTMVQAAIYIECVSEDNGISFSRTRCDIQRMCDVCARKASRAVKRFSSLSKVHKLGRFWRAALRVNARGVLGEIYALSVACIATAREDACCVRTKGMESVGNDFRPSRGRIDRLWRTTS